MISSHLQLMHAGFLLALGAAPILILCKVAAALLIERYLDHLDSTDDQSV